MDEGKILILNLSKGRIGEDNSMLLGALLITKLQLAAMSRVDIPEQERKDFFLYVDEFQNFATESFVNVLSEARKYRLSLILGHQYIAQMEEHVRDAVFGNMGTIVSFRVGAEDAEYLEKEFTPEFMAGDFVDLAKYNIYLKLMIDGLAGRPFSAKTLPPLLKPEVSNREKIIKVSRERYSVSKKIIEEKIAKWTGIADAPETPKTSPPVLYDAKCSSCNKWTKVIFPPDKSRSVYCKPCLKKIKNDREEKTTTPTPTPTPTPTISLEKAVEEEPVSFSSNKKNSSDNREKKPKRKEVNLEELKKVLEKSLKKVETKPEENENSKGV